jgi:large subunit ribosomal protein LP2
MKYIAAYLLARAGGNLNPSKEDIVAILETVGVSINDAQLTAVLQKLAGQDVNTLIAKGAANLSAVGGGGGGAAAAASSEGAPAEAAAPAQEEKKEEEAVLELAGGFDDLFG